jgi:hypothetical protein
MCVKPPTLENNVALKFFKFVWRQACLIENTAERALGNIVGVPRDDGHARPLWSRLEKLYMTATLADFDKSGGVKPTPDFPVRQRPKARQLPPQCWKLLG